METAPETEIDQVARGDELIAVLGELVMVDDVSLTARGIFEHMPHEVARAIVTKTSSWYMGYDQKQWRSIYLEEYVDSGHIQPDPSDSRRYQITELGQTVFENWLTS